MEIIPVIDVRGGVTVRAVAGDRANYRALETPLAGSADPVDVARGFCALFPFKTLYVADLDGIEGRGANVVVHEQVAEAWSGEVWIDDGIAGVDFPDGGIPPLLSSPTGGEELRRAPRTEQIPSPLWGGSGWGESQRTLSRRQVLGSETLANGIPANAKRSRYWVLSLDFRGDQFLGPHDILDRDDLWPERIIVMTLARVGAASGPDVARVAEIVRRARGRRVYAAGGVRGLDDIKALREAGAAGALVATALHAGKIKADELREIAGL
jgi:phosphoribosylformimino-5-aminoimidazole carboxamide ribotide isomerase